ncbi:MAG: AMP-binding protein [Acetobacteraceae bacterium]|nr:AMP-binding protein [Acetobacteraceae bacterium]MDW8398304.1 AMP-binding protein [Acetobacteraceae bacterium]
MRPLAAALAATAAHQPQRIALRFGAEAIPYRELLRRIERAAARLASVGVGRGDRVAILSLNRPEYLVALFACARLGAMLLPLNWRLAPAELGWIAGDAAPRAILAEAAFASGLAAMREAAPGAAVLPLEDPGALAGEGPAPEAGSAEDDLLLVYTSGTTGRPKGALLPQRALFANAVMSWHMHGMRPADHVLTVLPFFHVGGLNIQTTPALLLGATVTIHPRFDAAATLAALAADRPTLTVLVPATIRALAAHPSFAQTDLSSLRAVATGSETVHPATVAPLAARGVTVLQVYGATESCPIAIYTRAGGAECGAASTGHPGLLCEARVVDEEGREVPHGTAGEIELRGPNLFRGYWNRPDATAEAFRGGWFRTGDVATRDPATGAFTVHDRKKNLIISGGENIYPAEVERVLAGHPDVAECAVIGRPDPVWQEVPVAIVVPRPGRRPDAAAILAHVAAELARFKVPKEVLFVESLPRTALGKVQHFALRDLARQRETT